jgi:hypothetical protein
MTDLKNITGISDAAHELLEAAGIHDLRTLAKAEVAGLVGELERANRILQLARHTPTKSNVEQWIEAARESLGMEEVEEPAAPTPPPPVDFEATGQVSELLATAPFAIPLPARQLIDHRLAVSDIPAAILLNRYSGDLEIRVADRKGPRAIPRAPIRAKGRSVGASYVQLSEPAPPRLGFDPSRLRSITEMEPAGPRIPAAIPEQPDGEAPETDRVALIRAPLEKTNRGRNPQSKLYIRGVLHTHPLGMAFGALITLAMAVLLVPAVAASALLLLSDVYPEQFFWVSPWLLVLPCSLPVVGVLYLIYGVKGKCRICNQRQFFPRACRKNSKAHHIPGLGYIVPVCLHMLLFRWFRCTYCGTPVRLKK